MKKLVVGSLVMLLMLTMVGFSFAIDQEPREPIEPSKGMLFSLLHPKVAVAASSLLSNDVANVILDNSGNYTFFKKQGSSSGDVEDRTGATMYIKGFGAMEKFEMKDYTKFENTYYGGIIGFDWDRQYSDNFDATYGLFVAYAENELKEEDFEDNKLSSKNCFAGLRGNWYIGKLFFGAVLDYGYLSNKVEFCEDFEAAEGDYDYKIQSIGFSAKAGYNFEVAEKSFTIQPNVVFNSNYLLVEDFSFDFMRDYKSEAKDVYNFAVAPGLKIAKTLGRCWIVTAEGKYVFVSDNGDIKYKSDYGETMDAPDTYYKEYASCGIGIEKIWGYTVLHLKGHKTFCGRDGYMVNAGIEFKF